MWKLTLLVAVVANLATIHGSAYMDRLTMTMNEAINSRYTCNNFVTDQYTDQCSEIQSGYDMDVLKSQYDQANSGLVGTCIYQHIRTDTTPQITSVSALIKLMSQLCLNTQGVTRTQCYNLLNFNNNEEIRYFVPKMEDTTGDYISTLKTTVFACSDNDISDHYKSCVGQFNTEAQTIDCSDLSTAASAINQWFNASASYYEEVATADDIDDDVVLMTGSHHHVEITFKDFYFTEQIEKNFTVSDDDVVTLAMWSGEGYGKVSYNEDLDATVLQIALEGDRQAVIIHPKCGGLEEVLFQLRDSSVVPSLNDDTEWQYINVTMPIKDHHYGKEDYVDGLKLANQITQMYLPSFEDFTGIFDSQSGYVSHMFHTMDMKVNGLGATENIYASEDLELAETVLIDSAFVYYVVNSDAPELVGTWWY